MGGGTGAKGTIIDNILQQTTIGLVCQ